MADDARTEARRRIALTAHRLICSGCTDEQCPEMDEADWDVADAVLALFPYVDWQPWCMSHAVAVQYADRSDCDGLGPHDEGRQLVLHGGIDDLAFPEPVVPEEPPVSDSFRATVNEFMTDNAELMRRLADEPEEPRTDA